MTKSDIVFWVLSITYFVFIILIFMTIGYGSNFLKLK